VTSPTLLVATTRRPANGARAKPWFGPERASKMTVARAKLTPPTDDGRFSLASVGLVDWQFETIEPVAQIGDLIVPTAGGHDVLIYIHGYNMTFETAALDASRLSDGINSWARRWSSHGRRGRACSTTVTIAKARCGPAMPCSRCSTA
jgi:esterase/lipase superfamily enzyme